MTAQQLEASNKYLDLYDQYLDEPDANKRAELVIAMNDIERENGWI